MSITYGKDWKGAVYPKKGKGPFLVRYRCWEDRFKRNPWTKKRGFDRRSTADRFLRKAKDEYEKKWFGLHDPHNDEKQRPIEEHLDGFVEHLRARIKPRIRKEPEKHVNLATSRLNKAFADIPVQILNDLTLDAATKFLNGLKTPKGSTVSTKTRNDYSAILRQFGQWLEDDNRVPKNPLAALPLRDKDDREHRQALSWEKVNLLARAAIQRTLQSRARPMNREKHMESARRRSLAVLIAFCAGLRNNEIANLRWSMIDDEIIELPATITKSGKTESVPLHDGLRDVLRGVRREGGITAGRPVRDGELVVGYVGVDDLPTLPQHTPVRIREDAEWAKLPVVDDDGRVLDLHALRTSLANALNEEVPDGIVSLIMRHKIGGVTRKHYRRSDAAKLRPFINMIPREVVDVPGLITPISGKDLGQIRMLPGESACVSVSKKALG